MHVSNHRKCFKRIQFSGRVGEGVAIRREASKLDVNLNLKQSKEASTIEEVAPLNDNFDEYDIESYILPKCFSAESSNAYEDPWIHVDEKNDSSSPATEVSTTDATDSQKMSTRKRTCTAKEKNSNEEGYQADNSAKNDVIPNGYVPPQPDCTRPKHRKLIFSDVEKRKIQQNQMLTDESINIAQNLLYNQFDNIGGLEDTVVGQVKEFSVFTSNFIQIINTGMLHWICVSGNPAAEESRVYIYDSLSSGTITYVSAAQIANFMNCSESAITTTFQPVQQQLNGVDCGVFTIAFATSLAFGEDHTQIVYDNRKRQDHLIKCLERHEMRHFQGRTIVMKENAEKDLLKSVSTVHAGCHGIRMKKTKISSWHNVKSAKIGFIVIARIYQTTYFYVRKCTGNVAPAKIETTSSYQKTFP